VGSGAKIEGGKGGPKTHEYVLMYLYIFSALILFAFQNTSPDLPMKIHLKICVPI